MSEVLEINGLDALEPFRPAWQTLLERTAAGSFFQSLEWLEVYWRHFGEGQKLRVLIVAPDGQPTGILPLAVVPEQTRLGTIRTLTYPLHNWGSFYGPVGPDPQATLAAGLEHVGRTPADWDMLELRWAGEASSEQGHSAAAMKAAGLQACRTVWDRTAVIDMGGSWDDYLAAHTSKWRNNLFRAAAGWPSGARSAICGIARGASGMATAILAGTSTTPASRWPRGAGKAARNPAPR